MTQDQQTPGGQPAPQRGPSFGDSVQRVLREIAETVLPALIIVLFLNLFLIQSTRVQMQSMEPTLHEGQLLILEKVSYYLHPPQRGDIVVFRLGSNPSSHLIKRVIALPGDTLEIRNGRVYINGQLLNEPYESQPTYPNMPPQVIPTGSIFVMGDNRGMSNDSRSFGPVLQSDIIARAWVRYWPPDKIGVLR
ncbi:MAG TPA: signal peptidase I [Anaerolineae bacterium]|nr:signal peptidase I [Anaerolineae bacterium]HOQ97482.1 signal peptidase I [Anaerolineae bacterium]HPL29787.1 signal peptidase I [Anaerolineae bacterium]